MVAGPEFLGNVSNATPLSVENYFGSFLPSFGQITFLNALTAYMCYIFLGAFINLVVYRYWWYPPYKGHTIHVRCPKSDGFHAMDWDIKFSSVFFDCWFLQLTAMAAPMELHVQKCVEQEDMPGVAGFVQQELNHACMTYLTVIKAQQQKWYPGKIWLRIYTIVLFKILPTKLTMGLLMILESTFTPFIQIISHFYEHIGPFPRWNWALHIMEESEHCWSSMQELHETMGGCRGFLWRFSAWVLSIPIMFFVFFVFPIVEGCTVGFYDLIFRCRLPISLLHFVCIQPIAGCLMFGSHFLQVVLAMRPSDKTFADCTKAWTRVFEPYKDLFRHEYVQRAEADMLAREEVSVAGRKLSVYFNETDEVIMPSLANSATAPLLEGKARNRTSSAVSTMSRLSVTSQKSARLLAVSAVTYEVARQQLLGAGVSQKDVDKLFMENPMQDLSFKRDGLEESYKASFRKSMATRRASKAGGTLKEYTWAAVKENSSKSTPWLVIHDHVVDVSLFLTEHPGGQGILRSFQGRDVSDLFDAIHSEKAQEIMKNKIVGVLKES